MKYDNFIRTMDPDLDLVQAKTLEYVRIGNTEFYYFLLLPDYQRNLARTGTLSIATRPRLDNDWAICVRPLHTLRKHWRISLYIMWLMTLFKALCDEKFSQIMRNGRTLIYSTALHYRHQLNFLKVQQHILLSIKEHRCWASCKSFLDPQVFFKGRDIRIISYSTETFLQYYS